MPGQRAEHGETGDCHRVGVCRLGVGRLATYRPCETLFMSTKICAITSIGPCFIGAHGYHDRSSRPEHRRTLARNESELL